MKVFAISGSLRADSTNTNAIRAVASLASGDVDFVIYTGLGDLPHFSPDIDGEETAPAPVRDFRRQVREADAVLICTPEYIHGMPGSLKNALDWCASSGDFDAKPTAALSASPSDAGGANAHASLVQTLRVLGAKIPTDAMLVLPYVRRKVSADGAVTDPEAADAMRRVVEALRACIQNSAGSS